MHTYLAEQDQGHLISVYISSSSQLDDSTESYDTIITTCNSYSSYKLYLISSVSGTLVYGRMARTLLRSSTGYKKKKRVLL